MAGITLGVIALVTVISVMNGFEKELKNRILGVIPHIIVSSNKPLSSLNQFEHVSSVVPFRSTQALLQTNGQLQAVQVQGILPDASRANSTVANAVVQGSYDYLQAGEYQVLLGRQLAQQLNLVVGNKLKLLLAERTTYTPLGRMSVQRNFVVGGIFDSGSEVDASVAVIHLEDLKRLLRTPAEQNSWRLYLDDAFDAETVSQAIVKTFPDAELVDWRESQGELFAAVKMEKNIMWLMLALIIAVAVFNIVSALVMMVNERRNEIATLQTIGMTRTSILCLFVYQGMFKGCGGAIIGTLCALLLCRYLNPIMEFLGIGIFNGPAYQMQGLPIDVQAHQVILIAVSAIVMSFLATLYPAFRAANLQPAEVLKHE